MFVLKVGKHTIDAGSSTQTIVSLSSGEAEFYGAVKTACRLLGLQQMMKHMRWETNGRLLTDSSAAKGMASRRGAGGVRHIHTPALWLQQVISQKKLQIVKQPGTSNPPDIGTKVVTGEAIWRMLGMMNIFRMKGASNVQLTATV